MTKLQQLQRMVEVTPVLKEYAPTVTYTRGQGYHVRRDDGLNTLYFATFEIGQAYLSAWIGSNRQPSLANIRQGVKHKTAAQPVESGDAVTSVPMPTASHDASWGIVQLHRSLLGTVSEVFNQVKDGDSSLSWQAIGALTRVELFLRNELQRAGVELVSDEWAARRVAADQAWALSVGVTPDPVNLPTGESVADEVAAPSDPVAADDEPAPGEVCDSCGSDDLIDLSPGWIKCQNCGNAWEYDQHPFDFDDGFVPEENDPADDYGAAYPIHDDSWAYLEGDECNMCGKERTLNEKGYCASCWTIWNG